MLEITNDTANVKEVEELLQQRLLANPSIDDSLQICCLLKEETPFVTICCPESATVEPKQIFSLLRQVLREEKIWETSSVSMYIIWQEAQAPTIDTEEWGKLALAVPQSGAMIQLKNLSKRKSLFAGIGVGTGIGIVILTSCLYVLTRPCTIGNCPEIARSQQLNRQALTSIKIAASDREILAAQTQLNDAIALLKPIPGWSKHNSQAEQLLTDYQQRSQYLIAIVTAIQTAERANALAQNSSRWDEIQKLWQNAIASLQEIPRQSPWYAIAQVRRQDYEKNLAAIAQRREAQQQATTSLQKAREAAEIAQTRQNSARSSEEWQSVSDSWQTAVDRIRTISPGTTVYSQAQRQLELYTSQLTIARSREKQERSAANIYQQATAQAKLAADEQKNNRWSNAATHWRSALTFIQQVPPNTFQYSQAKPLIAAYTQALNRAAYFEQSDRILQQICTKENQICNYAIGDNIIQIKLSVYYTQNIWQAAIQAKASGNWQAQAELLDRIATLEKTLQNLSDRTGKRVEVYNSDGQLTIVYQPNQ